MEMGKVTNLLRKGLKLKSCGAVIVAAGNASRMGGIDKVMAPLGGEPMIVKTVRAFQDCDAIREIVVVTRQDLILPITSACREFSKVKAVVAGGKDRPASVRAGIRALSPEMKLVAIQDGARPLITGQVIDRTVRAANTYGAAVPGVPVKDTVKEAAGGMIRKSLDRSALTAVQTPQVFDRDLLQGALTKAQDQPITDDSSAVELMGMSVKLVEGDEENIKVTTPMDLKIAQMLWEERQ